MATRTATHTTNLLALLNPGRYERVEVRFSSKSDRTYSYLADVGQCQVGDRVVVPVKSHLSVPAVTAVHPVTVADLQTDYEYRQVLCVVTQDRAALDAAMASQPGMRMSDVAVILAVASAHDQPVAAAALAAA